MSRNLFALILLGAGLGHSLVGSWTSYTDLRGVRDLQDWKGNMYAATSGGVIKISSNGSQEVYRNTEGLRDVGISALASNPTGDLYATSELGYLYRYREARNDWEILSTAYRGAGWRMRERALAYRSGYLVLGSDKGLSFFNVAKKVADANISKMGLVSAPMVNSVLFVGDTLFAGTNRGIFRVTLHLDKLLTDPAVNIFNPAIWSQVPGTDGKLFFNPKGGKGDPAIAADSLRMDSAITATLTKDNSDMDPLTLSHGLLYHGAQGIASEFSGSEIPGRDARVSAYDSVTVGGKTISSAFDMVAIGYVNGIWYTGAPYGLMRLHLEVKGYEALDNPENIPKGVITAIEANRHGVYIYAPPQVHRLNGDSWSAVPGFEPRSDAADANNNGQHGFDVPADGDFYLGTWGQGFQAMSGGKRQAFNPTNSCIEPAVLPGTFSVSWSQVPYKDKGIWFSIFIVGKPYHIGYYDFAKGSVSCFKPNTNQTKPRNLQIVGSSNLVVVTERGVESFQIIDNGVAVTLDPVNRLERLKASEAETLAGKADRFGNFWVTTESSTLLYVPAIVFQADSVQSFRTLDGFRGTSCKSLEIDPQGHLWAGCATGGVFEIIPGKDSLSHSFRNYGLNEGLVSEVIFALDVNQDNGEVWIATEKGLSRFESASRPDKPDLSQAKVFPNPFLPKHAGVVFANLSPGSEIQVLTQSGSVVYQKSLPAGTGDQIRWDGRNRAGARIREGVYFYVIRSPKETKNGKIIVAR